MSRRRTLLVRHAVRKMKEDPSEPPCRRRLQTAISCFGPKIAVANVMVKRRDRRSRHVWIRECRVEGCHLRWQRSPGFRHQGTETVIEFEWAADAVMSTHPHSWLACQAASDVNLKTLHIHSDKTRHLPLQLISARAVATLTERQRIVNLPEYDPAVVY